MPAFKAFLTSAPTEDNYQRLGDALAFSPLSIAIETLANERWLAEVDWTDPDLSVAVAIRDAVIALDLAGLKVHRLMDQDMVTLDDIAQRVGVARETVRRWHTGDRGPGGFPMPLTSGREGAAFWSWVEVYPWLVANTDFGDGDGDPALVAANLLLAAARLLPSVPEGGKLQGLLSSVRLSPAPTPQGAEDDIEAVQARQYELRARRLPQAADEGNPS